MNINEKVAQVKTYIQEHKKQSIAVGLILLFLIGGSVALFAIPKSTGSAEKDNDNSSMVVSDISSGDTSSEEEETSSTESEEPQEESTPVESTAVESVTEETKPTDTKEPTKTETKKEDTTNVPTTKPSTGGTTTNKPSTGGSTTNKPSTGGETKPSHSHNWQPVTKQVNHPEQGHNEQVLVKEAWTESWPVYENKHITVCNGCGADITGNATAHNKAHMLAGEKGGYHNDVIQVQVGTDTVNHPAEYTTKYVVDKPAWTETVTTGHKCSCGATK